MKRLGFTVIEVLVVLLVVAMFFTISSTYLFGTLEKQQLLTQQQDIVNLLKTAQADARAAEGALVHGISISTTTITTIPQGKQIPLRSTIRANHSGTVRIVFDVLSGTPILGNSTDEFKIELHSRRFKAVISVNQNGVIESLPIERK